MESIKLEADGKTITINIKIKNEEAYSFLKEVEEEKRIERLVTTLRIGILGFKRMNVAENIDYVEKEFNTLASKFEKMFDPSIKTSHLGKLTAILEEYFERGGKVESIFDPLNEGTPIAILRKEIMDKIQEIRDELIKKDAKQEVINSTTLKGYEFEDTCEEIFSEIVRNNMGDEFERKTNETGEITGCLSGDFVTSLKDKPDKKIVFETKDVENISQRTIIETMEKAMSNRNALYGVFVVKNREGIPKKIGVFNEFRGNILVVALGSKDENTFFPQLLHVAYQWARLRVSTEINMEQKALKVLDESIKQISEKLETFSQIQRQCTNIEKATDEIRQYSDDLRNDIDTHIQQIQEALTSLEDGDSE